jgi:hypothetical protein
VVRPRPPPLRLRRRAFQKRQVSRPYLCTSRRSDSVDRVSQPRPLESEWTLQARAESGWGGYSYRGRGRVSLPGSLP